MKFSATILRMKLGLIKKSLLNKRLSRKELKYLKCSTWSKDLPKTYILSILSRNSFDEYAKAIRCIKAIWSIKRFATPSNVYCYSDSLIFYLKIFLIRKIKRFILKKHNIFFWFIPINCLLKRNTFYFAKIWSLWWFTNETPLNR